jgi:hypothetical protein
MAIGFTAELSHYPSGGRYATQAGIDAAAAPLPPSWALPARQVRLPISQEVHQASGYGLGPLPPIPPPGPPGPHCSLCYRNEAGECGRDCVWNPPGELPYVSRRLETVWGCPPGACCPPGQDACYDPYRPAKFCCPPGTSCCDPDNHLCCPAGYYCCISECCPADQACTEQGCSPPQDLLCGGQDCTVVLPPGSNPACCNNECTDTNRDVNNCGGCGHVCTAPDGGGPTCTGGCATLSATNLG